MTKNKTTIHLQSLLALPLMATLLALLAACSSEETVTAGGDDNGNNGSVQIQFTLAVENGKQTRATTWGDDYDKEAANTWENMIDGGLQVFLYDTWSGNSYGGTIKAMKAETFVVSSTQGSNGYEYSVLGTFPLKKDEINSNYPYRLVVLANAPDCETSGINSESTQYNQPWNTQTFQASTITYDTENNKITGGYIPMWGTQKYATIWDPGTHLELKEGTCVDAGTIYLLRAMAKIVVKLDAPATGEATPQYTLTGVTLDKYNQTGNIAPMGKADSEGNRKAGDVDKTTDAEIEGGLNVNGSATEKSLPFIKQKDDEGNECYIVYIPEMKAEDAKGANIKLNVSNGSTVKERSFTLDSYVDGKPSGNGINIVRNTIYEYTVTVGTSDLTVNLKQMPWNIYDTSVSYSYKNARLFAWNGWSSSDATLKAQYEENSNADDNAKNASVFYNGYLGDMEAVHSFVCYPCPAIDEADQSKENVTPSNVKNESSTADFYFTIEPGEGAGDRQVMWRALLSNDDYFEFATDKTWNDGTATRYCAASGVARKGQPYKISVRAKKPWQNLNGKSEDSFSNSSSWGSYAHSEEWERNTPPSTNLYIQVSQDGETWENLAINGVNTGMVGSHHSAGPITGNDGKPYEGWRRFGGGEFYVRIFQLKAEGDSNGNWIGWHATSEKNKENDTEYVEHKSNDESEDDGTEKTIAP